MISNNKCILTYGLSDGELDYMKKLKYKIVEITPEMCEMTILDILSGLRLDTFNSNPIKEKVILYNNLSNVELQQTIKKTREYVKDGILAMVTAQSINWKVNYLINHLKEEKEWHSKVRKDSK